MLPVETPVWANTANGRSSANTVINATRVNRKLGQGESGVNIVHLPFGMFAESIFISLKSLTGFSQELDWLKG
jgi:hypothetical protein